MAKASPKIQCTKKWWIETKSPAGGCLGIQMTTWRSEVCQVCFSNVSEIEPRDGEEPVLPAAEFWKLTQRSLFGGAGLKGLPRVVETQPGSGGWFFFKYFQLVPLLVFRLSPPFLFGIHTSFPRFSGAGANFVRNVPSCASGRGSEARLELPERNCNPL